jgi:filamentous hemagglutinin
MRTTLEPGERFDRYGGTGGNFMSPEGTSYPERSLPASSLASGYHVYEVLRPIPATQSKTAEAFGEPGGGTQIQTDMTVEQLLAGKNPYLKEVFP